MVARFVCFCFDALDTCGGRGGLCQGLVWLLLIVMTR